MEDGSEPNSKSQTRKHQRNINRQTPTGTATGRRQVFSAQFSAPNGSGCSIFSPQGPPDTGQCQILAFAAQLMLPDAEDAPDDLTNQNRVFTEAKRE